MAAVGIRERCQAQAGFLSVFVIAVAAVIVLALILARLYIPGYDRAIRLEQAADEAWADIEPRPYFESTETARTAPPEVDFSNSPSEPAPQPSS